MKLIFQTLLFFIVILFSGCVEHIITFNVQPDGYFNVSIYSHGDKQDLLDVDFVLPSSNPWSVNSNLDVVDVETFDYNAEANFAKNEKYPSSFYEGDSVFNESLLKTPTFAETTNWFFWKSFTFSSVFQSRNVLDKYPKVFEFLEDSENSQNGWLKEALKYVLFETLDRSNIEFNLRPIIKGDLEKWYSDTIESLNDSLLFVEIEFYKLQGLDIIMQPNPAHKFEEMDSIYQVLEDELNITLDLADDEFTYHVILPGKLLSHNADTTKHDTLIWNFNLLEFAHADYEMKATAEIVYPNRQIIGWIVLILGLVSFIWIRKVK